MSTKYQSLSLTILIMVELTFVDIIQAKNLYANNAPCKFADGSIVADTYCHKICATYGDLANNYCNNGRKCCVCGYYPPTKSGSLPPEFVGQMFYGYGLCSKKQYWNQTDVTISRAPKLSIF